MSIRIRLFVPADGQVLITLIKRLSEFEMPVWRHPDQIENTNVSMLKTAMEELDPEDAIYVAEDEMDGQVVGFVRLQTQVDYFSREKLGYIANIAVDKNYESQGIGRKLIESAEKWAREKGYGLLRLHVFVENERAQQIYKENGFQQDIVSYVKRVAHQTFTTGDINR